MSRVSFFGLITLGLVACATPSQKRAEAAFARGDYLDAAQQYDEAVRERPDRERLRERRWEARSLAVSELADKAAGFRAASKVEPALVSAGRAVAAQSDWFSGGDAARLPSDVAAKVREVSSWAAEEVSAQVRRELAAERPLAARAALTRARPLFEASGIAHRADALASAIVAAGTQRCTDLSAALTPEVAHLVYFVAQYCQTFSAAAPSVPVSPEQVSSLSVQADTLGVSGYQRTLLEQRIGELLKGTSWYHAAATSSAEASISGHESVTFSSVPAHRSASWVELVPYHVQESYQEPYSDYEHYTAQEPYTEYRSESYSCGGGYGSSSYSSTCYRSVPHTSYRSVSKTRMVTKYRTKWRTVTRHRSEARVFMYDVREHVGRYEAAWDIALTFPARAPQFDVRLRSNDERKADQHDITFLPANVRPQRAELTNADGWFDERLRLFSTNFPLRARDHWIWSFCSGGEMSAEAAARCARGALDQTPESAWSVLSTFLRDDARLLAPAKS